MDSGRGGGDVLIAEAVTMSLYERQHFAGRARSRVKRTSTSSGYRRSFSMLGDPSANGALNLPGRGHLNR
jgi:hypothetical protein